MSASPLSLRHGSKRRGIAMTSSTTRSMLGIGVTLIVAVGAIAIGDDRYDDVDGALAKACAGAATSHQLENALFNARARSDGGFDPICSPPENEDDFDGVMLSHSPSTRDGATGFGAFGAEGRRR
jgi:hypothetical protein